GRLVLPAELALAVAPAAVRDHGGDALVDPPGIDADRAAEARADERDARAVDGRMLSEIRQRTAGILDLLQADHASVLARAVAAAAHVEAQRHVAELVEHLGRSDHGGRAFVAAEAVQQQERGALFARLHAVGYAHDPGQPQPGRRKGDGLFWHAHYPSAQSC